MSKTTERIYKEFCERYPYISKDCVRYSSWGSDEIKLWGLNGEIMIYSTVTRLVRLIEA